MTACFDDDDDDADDDDDDDNPTCPLLVAGLCSRNVRAVLQTTVLAMLLKATPNPTRPCAKKQSLKTPYLR